ncbi:MAG: ABC transporter permease, partial [Delftia acidovorans]|nr:ABC transporter permease [Delftia acidovorans]
LATGVALSLVNAFLIERMAIPSIIATIATMTAYFSTLMAWTGGRAIYTLPDWWTRRIVFWRHETDGGDIVRIGLPIVLLLVIFAATHLLIGYTRAGRQLRAVGGNAEAARRIGVRIGRVQMIAYGYLGLCAALAGLLQSYRVGQAVPNAMVGSELNVVAAAVLGGASLTGGRGSAAGVMLGILLLAMLQNGLTLLSVPSFHFQTVIGAVLLLALVVISRNERRVLRGTGR